MGARQRIPAQMPRNLVEPCLFLRNLRRVQLILPPIYFARLPAGQISGWPAQKTRKINFLLHKFTLVPKNCCVNRYKVYQMYTI